MSLLWEAASDENIEIINYVIQSWHAINKLKDVYHNQQGELITTDSKKQKTKPKSRNWHISFSIYLQQILKYKLRKWKTN